MTTSVHLADDAANPVGTVPPDGAIIAAGYIGGDAAHVWTEADWNRWGCRYRIPIWVRSNPQQVNAVDDVASCLAALQALKAPPPYFVLPYGSTSTLFQNPVGDGYWPADPTGVPHMYNHAGVVATQFGFDGTFDISEVLDSVFTWDTVTGLGPTSVMLDLETAVDVGYVTAFINGLHGNQPIPPSGSDMFQIDGIPGSWFTFDSYIDSAGTSVGVGLSDDDDGKNKLWYVVKPAGGNWSQPAKFIA